MLVEYFDFAMTMRQAIALEYGVGPVAAAMSQLVFVLSGLVAFAAPVLAQEQTEEQAPEQETVPPAEPVVVTPEDATQPAPAPAAEAEDAIELETIQVTAGKRIKAQRDMPASVGAISGDQLEQM